MKAKKVEPVSQEKEPKEEKSEEAKEEKLEESKEEQLEEMEASLSVLTRKLELYQNSMVELQMENDQLHQELTFLQNKIQFF